MIRYTTRILFNFTTRLKGPKTQRQAIKKGQIYEQQQKVEDFFKDYYKNTVQLYKDNYTPQELENSNEMVKRVFSLENATPSQILKYRIAQAVKKYQKNPTDVGSSAIQCASMSQRIIFLMMHTKKYPKDIKGARALNELIDQRRKMLNYLMRTDYHRYKWVCIDYGIPEVHPKTAHHQTNFRCKENKFGGI